MAMRQFFATISEHTIHRGEIGRLRVQGREGVIVSHPFRFTSLRELSFQSFRAFFQNALRQTHPEYGHGDGQNQRHD